MKYGIPIAMITIVVLIGTLAFGNQIRPWFQAGTLASAWGGQFGVQSTGPFQGCRHQV